MAGLRTEYQILPAKRTDAVVGAPIEVADVEPIVGIPVDAQRVVGTVGVPAASPAIAPEGPTELVTGAKLQERSLLGAGETVGLSPYLLRGLVEAIRSARHVRRLHRVPEVEADDAHLSRQLLYAFVGPPPLLVHLEVELEARVAPLFLAEAVEAIDGLPDLRHLHLGEEAIMDSESAPGLLGLA